MTTSDPAWTGVLVLIMLVTVVGGGLVGPAWFAWRHDKRWPSLLLAGIALLGVVVAGQQGRRGVADLAWVAVSFALVAAVAAFAWAAPSRTTRAIAIAAAFLPPLTIAWFVLTDIF